MTRLSFFLWKNEANERNKHTRVQVNHCKDIQHEQTLTLPLLVIRLK